MNTNDPYFVLVASKLDSAGMNMAEYLVENGFSSIDDSVHSHEDGGRFLCSKKRGNVRLHISDKSQLMLEDLDHHYPHAKSFIFLSKHKSDSKIPTLTCHCTGNFDSNPYGGRPKEIAIAWPYIQKEYLRQIVASRAKVPKYDIIIEATHHGPTSLKKPVLFVELGSSEEQWADKNAAEVICRCVLEVLTLDPSRPEDGRFKCEKVAVALGGTHYPTKFNKLLLESEFGLAAVASKYNLELIDEAMLWQMIEKSVEKVTHIALDTKGLGSHKERILALAQKTGLEILKL